MTATAHALVSAAIAASIPNPAISISLAFVSHFVMDAIPHWDFGTNWRTRTKFKTGAVAIFDTILGFSLAYLLFSGKVEGATLLAAMIAGNLPDWMEAPYYIFFATQKKRKPAKNASFWEQLTFRIYKMENVFHAKAQAPFGVITQIVTVIFFFVLLQQL
jgi:hypothetical protein